ncbi:hypothetical protein [Acinetobacter sp.]|uniref:hypothetical protein n=1 Tax=Acinetobacter sp. TaxID=472 RepID=UPI003342B56F
MIVNLLTVLIIGLAVSFCNSSLNENYKFSVISACGRLNTFSTFSMKVMTLLQVGKFAYAFYCWSLYGKDFTF